MSVGSGAEGVATSIARSRRRVSADLYRRGAAKGSVPDPLLDGRAATCSVPAIAVKRQNHIETGGAPMFVVRLAAALAAILLGLQSAQADPYRLRIGWVVAGADVSTLMFVKP